MSKAQSSAAPENFSSSWVELLHCATRCQKQPTSPCSPLWEKSCVYNRVHLNYWYHRDCFDFRLDCLPLPSYLTDEDEDADEAMAATAALSFVKALRTSSLSSEKRIRLTCWSSGVPVSRKIRSVDSSLRNLSRTSEQCGKYRLPSSTVFVKASRRSRNLLFCIVGVSFRSTSFSLLKFVMPANSSVESACAMRMTSLASEGKNILAKATA